MNALGMELIWKNGLTHSVAALGMASAIAEASYI
jgi:hypothetical protein